MAGAGRYITMIRALPFPLQPSAAPVSHGGNRRRHSCTQHKFNVRYAVANDKGCPGHLPGARVFVLGAKQTVLAVA